MYQVMNDITYLYYQFNGLYFYNNDKAYLFQKSYIILIFNIKITFFNKVIFIKQLRKTFVFLWFYMIQKVKLIYFILQLNDRENKKTKKNVECIKE